MKMRAFALVLSATLLSSVWMGGATAQAAPVNTSSPNAWCFLWFCVSHNDDSDNNNNNNDNDTKLSWYRSSVSVSPSPGWWQSDWPVADGKDGYTITLKARNNNGDLMKDLDVADIEIRTSGRDTSVSSVVNNGDGTYKATITATTRNFGSAWVTYKGLMIGWTMFVPFTD